MLVEMAQPEPAASPSQVALRTIRSTRALITGAASTTTGSIDIHENTHAFPQCEQNDPASQNGRLAMPAAIAHVIADWIRPNNRWLCRSRNANVSHEQSPRPVRLGGKIVGHRSSSRSVVDRLSCYIYRLLNNPQGGLKVTAIEGRPPMCWDCASKVWQISTLIFS
jgi:hypothetical protein